jgi:hypothetical protein
MDNVVPIIVVLTVLGYYFNMDKDPYIKHCSYWIWLGTNTFWMSLNISREFYDMALMFAIYCGFCIWGIYKYFKG